VLPDLRTGLRDAFGQDIEQRQKLAFHHIVVAGVLAALIGENQILGFLALCAKLPFPKHEDNGLRQRNCPHASGGLGDILFAVGIDAVSILTSLLTKSM
jgi:hypothetical protein